MESEVTMPSIIKTFVRNAYPALADDVDDLFKNDPSLEFEQIFINTLTTLLALEHAAFRQPLPDTDKHQASQAMLYLSNARERADIFNILRVYKYMMQEKVKKFPAADHDISYKIGMAFLMRCAHAIQLQALRKAS